MSDPTLEERVQTIVAERLDAEPAAVSSELRFSADPLAADSLDLIEVAEAIDDALDVYVPDRALSEVETVGDLTAAVRSHRE